MSIYIRKGLMSDVDELEKLYDELNDYSAKHINYSGFKKGVYPTRVNAVCGIEENNLYVAIKEDVIVGSFILRHKPEEAYYSACWKKELTYDKVLVIYTFVVHPDYSNQGIGSEQLKFAEQLAKAQGVESLRLDVYSENLPAIHVYEKNGFEYIDTVDLGLEEYGLKWYKLYEKLIH
jgi:ribosomal protein S18 acetylase RimI-like enzyme